MARRRQNFLAAAVVLALAASVGFADRAVAQANKKVSYAEAFKRCKALVDKEIPLTGEEAQKERYLRGGACLKKYGYGF
jgi:hypothetical protein